MLYRYTSFFFCFASLHFADNTFFFFFLQTEGGKPCNQASLSAPFSQQHLLRICVTFLVILTVFQTFLLQLDFFMVISDE